MSMRSPIGGLVVALALMAPGVCAAQTREARNTVAEAVFAYSGTSAAAERALDSRLLTQRREIAALSTRTRAESARNDTLTTDLAALQERFVTELAARDRAYARELEVFRGAMVDIAAEPAGLAALQRFNNGDELGALAALDQVRTARVAARQARNDIESAAEGRRIAALALEARSRGRVDTASVIARFEDVTRLDPGVHWDWVELARLYIAAVRPAEARRAVIRATETAQTDWDRAIALGEDSTLLSGAQDYEGALRSAEASVALWRQIAATDGQVASSRNLSFGLIAVGNALALRGNAMISATGAANQRSPAAMALLSSGLNYLQEALRVREQIAQREPGSARAQHDIADAHQQIAFVYGVQGELAACLRSSEAALAIIQRLSAADPGLTGLQIAETNVLARVGAVLSMQGNTSGARERYQAALLIDRQLAAADPTDIRRQRTVYARLQWIAHAYANEGNWPAALAAYQEAIAFAEGVIARRPDIGDVHAFVVMSYQWLAGRAQIQGDEALARRHFESALTAARRYAQALPSDIEAQNAVWRGLFLYRSNYRGAGGVTWRQVLTEMERVQARGMLRELNSGRIDTVRQNAAQETQP